MKTTVQFELREDEQRLLEEVQRDIPLITRPFLTIADKIGMSESSVIDTLERFIEQGLIREVSAIFNGAGLGYKSTLVAVKAEVEAVDAVAKRINSHPGVSHNYLRQNPYNIWFTLTVKKDGDFNRELEELFTGFRRVDYLILPSIRTFKIRVQLPFTNNESPRTHLSPVRPVKKVELTDVDRLIVLSLQSGLPIVSAPWGVIARDLHIDEQTLLYRIRRLYKAGVIKRISAVLRHRKAGFQANGMACFQVPKNRIITAGRRLARYPEVSHCYERKTCAAWPYPLYAMVHKKKKEECLSAVDLMAGRIKCENFLVLFSVKEFKKERVKYLL